MVKIQMCQRSGTYHRRLHQAERFTDLFRALLIGYYKNSKLHYAGKVGTGFTDEILKQLGEKLKGIEASKSPFAGEIHEKNVHWVRPKLVCQIGFTEWTSDSKLRHPRFLGLRRDKKPEDVKKES
jgi:bifunctional non-homologous end joining protein LigD